MDQDQKCLIDCLNATLDTNHEIRSFAEESLKQASLQPGFGAALAKIVFNKDIPFGLRQLAAVLLKQFIKQHWEKDEDNFIPPIVSPEEKGVIRELLMVSLEDQNAKIRTAIGMAIAVIGQFDWPENWPQLLPFLLKLINDQTNQNGVRGALRCLALLSDDLDDSSVPRLVPELFPSLYKIISSPQLYGKSLRAKALSIIHSCIYILGSMSGVYQKETIDMVKSIHNPLMEQFTIILQSPVQLKDPDDWSLKMQVLKCLLQILQHFPSILEAASSAILGVLWQTFVSSYEVYYLSCIKGTNESYANKYDSDGEEQSLEAFVIQLFELLTTIVCNSKFVGIIGKNLKDLAYYIVAFQQITQEQEQTWSLDANQFVADEDDVTYSCRVSGAILLEEIINADGDDSSVIEACKARFEESCQAKLNGHPDWWRLQEACLFAIFSVSEQILESDQSNSELTVGLIEQMVTQNTGSGVDMFPFLLARSFATVSKFHSLISKKICEQFICDAAQAISMDVSPPVKVGACRVLTELLLEAKQEIVQPLIIPLLSSLTNLLTKASEETLHLVLETIQAAVRAAGEQFITVEPVISPIILNIWAQNISDPFISIDAIEILEAIKSAPGCIQPLICRILPTIVPILQKPKNQGADLVGGSLDLLTMLLKNEQVEVVKAVFGQCFDSTVQIVLESEDHAEMQNATECLAAFVSMGKQEMLTWGDQAYIMKRLLEAASRLLDPNLESSVSLFVGNYILQLILNLNAQMSPHLHELVIAVIKRLESADIESLKCSLILILARLVHFSAPNVNQFIHLLKSIPANGYENSLAFVMFEWTKLQGEIQGAYQIKVTTSALALILSTKNPDLSKIIVQGHIVKKIGGIKTRSKSKSAPEQWTMVPLSVKIFSILADTISEIMEQISDNEDSDWEEVPSIEQVINDEIMIASKNNNSNKHLDVLAKIFGQDSDDDEDDIDEDTIVDPLNEIKLSDYITNFFKSISESDRPFFDYLFQGLTNSQKPVVSRVLKDR